MFRHLLIALALTTAVSATPSGFTHIRTLGNITEYTLDSNRLQVLLLPDPTSTTVTFMVTYRVGSRNEVTGTTGATHLLEHLMFKGTPTFNRDNGNSIDQFLESIGGLYNATTWLDRTNYFATIPPEHLQRLVQIEADRMTNLSLRDEDRQPEMTVVRNEFEIGENNPLYALDKEITATAYIAHPYHHPTIGWRSDIETITIEELRHFYQTFYHPDNATVTIIGNFTPGDALDLVKQYYGNIPPSDGHIPQVRTIEPAQTGPRRVTVQRAGQLPILGIAYKTPAATHADIPALQLLSVILAEGKTSRFYRALTDKNITLSVDADLGLHHDPSLLTLYLFIAPGASPDTAEKTALEEINKIKTTGISPDELSSALARLQASTAYARDGTYAIASTINESIAAGDWTLYETTLASLAKVTPADIQRVAQTYLQQSQSTTGTFLPKNSDNQQK